MFCGNQDFLSDWDRFKEEIWKFGKIFKYQRIFKKLIVFIKQEE